MSQEDEQPTGRHSDADQPRLPADNSIGRLLTLSDGIFAISMTLLALNLQVPDLGAHPSDASLRHALAAKSDSYWSFLLTFYVVAGYWRQHRRLMRSVVQTHPALIRDTLALLLLVAAMPFPASLLGRYGSEPIALATYGAVNALATLSLIVMSADVRRSYDGRGRDGPLLTGSGRPPARIPASGTTALGSCLGYERQTARMAMDAKRGWEETIARSAGASDDA